MQTKHCELVLTLLLGVKARIFGVLGLAMENDHALPASVHDVLLPGRLKGYQSALSGITPMWIAKNEYLACSGY